MAARRKRRSFSSRRRRFVSAKFGDRSIAKVAQDLDLTETALREWVRSAEANGGGEKPPEALTGQGCTRRGGEDPHVDPEGQQGDRRSARRTWRSREAPCGDGRGRTYRLTTEALARSPGGARPRGALPNLRGSPWGFTFFGGQSRPHGHGSASGRPARRSRPLRYPQCD